MLQRNYNKHVEKWGAEWLRVGSTLTLKPDLDNANVGIYGEHRGCVYTIGIYTVFFVLRVLFKLFEWGCLVVRG